VAKGRGRGRASIVRIRRGIARRIYGVEIMRVVVILGLSAKKQLFLCARRTGRRKRKMRGICWSVAKMLGGTLLPYKTFYTAFFCALLLFRSA